ncbi:MAG: tRNA lysidine(34) synthetase TilS [Desulfosalsimonadaceae bacterium]
MPISENRVIIQPFIRKVLQTIRDHDMLPKGSSVLVGVSGGPDSMALLHALIAVSDHLSIRVGVAHLNHCLRPGDADLDAEFVIEAARKYSVPFYVKSKNIHKDYENSELSLEEAARDARYRFFHEVCREKGFDKIAVGHHQEDNAELILLYLLRGSGPVGMGGILPVRDNIVRPLIRTSRTEIIGFLASQDVTYRMDASNFNERFLRNRIRHQLIPLIEKNYNPRISESLNRLGNILQAEEQWMNPLVAPIFDQTVADRAKGRISLSVSRLVNLPVAPLRRVLRRAIQEVKGDLRRIAFSHVDAVIDLTARNRADGILDLPDRIRVSKQADLLMITKENTPLRRTPPAFGQAPGLDYVYTISESGVISGNTLYLHETGTFIKFTRTHACDFPSLSGGGGNVAFFDWDRIQFPLTIRNYRTGDRFTPVGMTGSQTVKKFFINNKISPCIRTKTPIFLSGEMIIWIGGFRIADPVKVTQRTRHLLAVEMSPETDNI